MFAPKLLASAVVFSKHSKYPVDIVTVKPSVFLSLSKDRFVSYLMKNEALLRNFLIQISDSFAFITDRFYEITMKNLVQKVCSYLMKLMEEQKSEEVILNMTKEELAREFGATRPSLSRVFIELEKKGIISMEGRYVIDYATLF